jgi:hypothetical protein
MGSNKIIGMWNTLSPDSPSQTDSSGMAGITEQEHTTLSLATLSKWQL